MGVDLGFEVDGNQQAESIADIAALDMARYINIADWVPGGQSVDYDVPERETGQRQHRQQLE